jgi:hypothetical protein
MSETERCPHCQHALADHFENILGVVCCIYVSFGVMGWDGQRCSCRTKAMDAGDGSGRIVLAPLDAAEETK